jgi:hypothetical protein
MKFNRPGRKICYICLEQKHCFPDRDRGGIPVCNDCFGNRYRNKRQIEQQPSLEDLKKKWERKQ